MEKSKDSLLLRVYNWALDRRGYIPFLPLNIVSRNIKGKGVLDVGCGKGDVMRALALSSKQIVFSVGVDIYLSYIEECKKHRSHTQLVLADAQKLPFRDKSFETVLCVEVIEHLEKEAGKELIRSLEQIAQKQVIITTPVGFVETKGECLCPFDGTYSPIPYQFHKSGWQPWEFKELGYQVRGCRVRGLRSKQGWERYFPRILRPMVVVLLESICGSFVYFLPTIAGGMVCIKNLADRRV